MSLLLRRGEIRVNMKCGRSGTTAVHEPSYAGNVDVVELLLDKKDIEINARDNELNRSVENASFRDFHQFCVEEQIPNSRMKCKSFGRAPLHTASSEGNAKIVQSLLNKKNIDINAKDSRGFTALIWASYYGRLDVAKLLAEGKGIDANVRARPRERTALHYASETDNADLVKVLLGIRTIEINTTDHDVCTPLYYASC